MKHLALLIITFFYSWQIVAQTVLEYNLKQGDTFMVQQKAHQTITQELEGASHELINDMNGILEFKVTSVQQENYEIDLMFRDLNLNMKSSIQGELMNIKAKEVSEEDIQSQIFNSLLDTPVKVILSKNGNILEVKGGDSLISKMANASGIEDEFSKNMMKSSLEKEFGSKALSNSYKQLTYIYTDNLVAPGDTWENEYEGKLTTKNKWTFESLNETNAMISGIADIQMKTEESGTVMILNGSQNTTIKTDLKTGFILNMTVEGKAAGSSKMLQLGDQEIPTTIISTITYELIQN